MTHFKITFKTIITVCCLITFSADAFAQQSNVKDKAVVDTVKKPVTTTEQANKDHREVDGKGRPASVVYGGTIDRQIVVQKDSGDTNGKNNNAKKGWDGKVQGKTVTFPYPCSCCGKTIEYTTPGGAAEHQKTCCPPPPSPTGTVTVGKIILNNCPPPCDWDTLVPGGPEFQQSIYVVSDGLFNGKKELLSIEEVKSAIERQLQLGFRFSFRGVLVQKHKVTGLTVLIAYYTCCLPGDKSVTNDRIEKIIIPLKEEKGYLKMSGIAVKETRAAGETTIAGLGEVKSKRHDYVGHVTLLR